MPYYMVQAAYTPDTWAAMVKSPENRQEAVRPVVERMGGRLVGTWFAFGEYDVVGILELPNNAAAAAVALAFAAGGALKAQKTTVLLSMEEGMEAMRRAQGAGYRVPSA